MTSTPRFPFGLPFGWFALGRLDELPDEPLWRTTALGEELVVWRDGNDVRVFDAYCPHLGADLGVGGTVDDGCLVCPFHGWVFDGDGANVAIPYADKANRKAHIRSYPTVTANRMLLFWWHPDPDVAPMWEVPDVLPASYEEAGRSTWEVGTAWQEVAENSVDMAHFSSVHGLERPGEIGELTIDGPVRQVKSTQAFNTARGSFDGAIHSTSYGPGMGITHFDLMGRVTLVANPTPIDEDHLVMRFTMYHSGEGAAAKIAPPFAAEVERQFREDIPIWEHKRYLPSPALAPSEKAVTQFRRWAAQFYAEPAH